MKRELSDDELETVSGGLQPVSDAGSLCPVGCKPDPDKQGPGGNRRPETVADTSGAVIIAQD